MTAYYNEIDPYCVRLLRKHIAAGNLPDGVVDDRDIREVQPDDLRGFHQVHLFAGIGGIPLGFKWAGMPDDFGIWTGGFPCQDVSAAGRRVGLGGERSGLWFEYARLVRDLRPRYVLVENVAALLWRGIGDVLGDLADCGYDAEWTVLSACELGAPHSRERVFLLAYPHRPGRAPGHLFLGNGELPPRHPHWQATQGKSQWQSVERWLRTTFSAGQWGRHPTGVQRVDDGDAARVDRLRGLGNGVVPQCAEWIGRRILEAA